MLYARYANHLRPARIAALLTIEILVLLWAYSFTPHCVDVASYSVCPLPSKIGLRAMAFLFVLGLIVFARSNIRALLCCDDREKEVVFRWVWVQLVGFCLVMLPRAVGFRSEAAINPALIPWILGGYLVVFGAAFALASPERWRAIIVELGPVSLILLVASLLAPEITAVANDVWHFQPLTQITFQSVLSVLKVFGVEAIAEPTRYVLSSNSFRIRIEPPCSGVEGFALTTLFFVSYFYAFKEHLRFPNVWVLLPIGLLFSWAFNVVRIAALFLIGINGHPELAVDGFHGHAGWLTFSILALTMIGVSTSVPWFWRGNTDTRPLLEDWTAASTLPFAAFMAAALLLSTFTVIPDLWYVAKVVAISSVLGAFLPVYRTCLFWQIDTLVVLAGIAIGLLWIAFGFSDESRALALDTALASLPLGLWVGWVIVRLIGTIALVPVAEELMFRGYLLERFSRNGGVIRAIGLLLSTGLFAVMHQRWALAGCAGLIYGLLYLRSYRVTDAIVAHSASNAIIGLYALATAQWSLI
jgi:exosortase E/protease (VPEID-CTERM system)